MNGFKMANVQNIQTHLKNIACQATATAPKFHLDRSGAAAMEASASPQMPVAGAP